MVIGKDNGAILVAEDDRVNRELLETILDNLNPEIFSDGVSLVERLHRGDSIRLVLTDNEMPGVTGSRVIKDFAQTPGYENTRFVLVYAGDKAIGDRAVVDGAFAYLQKPWKIEDLLGIVQKALD